MAPIHPKPHDFDTADKIIEVFSPHFELFDVTQTPHVGTAPATRVVQSKPTEDGRYILDLSTLAGPSNVPSSVTLHLGDKSGDHTAFEVQIPLGTSRKFRNRGWRRLNMTRGRSPAEHVQLVNAFQIHVR